MLKMIQQTGSVGSMVVTKGYEEVGFQSATAGVVQYLQVEKLGVPVHPSASLHSRLALHLMRLDW